MSDKTSTSPQVAPSRREFIKTTSALVGGAMLGAHAGLASAAHVVGSDEIKVALIGCGARGNSAALQALQTEGKVTLWAVADAFEDQVERCIQMVSRGVERGRRQNDPLLADSTVDVPRERRFAGFNAYQQAIDSGADLVLLATPPGFRPQHFEAAVQAEKHVFMEKPLAVDSPGVRRILAANDDAKQKNLMVAVGLQRRHHPYYLQTIERINSGDIGDIVCTRVYWNGGDLWVRPRSASQTEMEYQMRNWYYFNWLCGDHIVEQHIHNIDVGNWLRGDIHPVEANGMGGRELRRGKDHGQIFDHHFVEFTYEDGTKMFSQCRQMNGCFSSVSEHAHGTRGTLDISDYHGGRIEGVHGSWRTSGPGVDAHHQELHDLFAALRRGDVYNEGDYSAASTMAAIMGRMATYTGRVVKWDDAFNSSEDLSPAEYDFAAAPPVVPDEDGNYPVPRPGASAVS